MKVSTVIWCLWVLLVLALHVGFIYVAVHFISKYW